MDHNRPRLSAKLYQEDIVRSIEEPKLYGLVVRCWHDAEDLPNVPPEVIAADPLMRPLEQGEVGVSFYPKGVREILSETKLTLVDRTYQPGDLLKRNIDDLQAGIVTSIDVQGRLEHAITGEQIPGWISTSQTESAVEVDLGDYVVCNDWVGQIVEMFDEAVVEMSGGNLVRLPELSARLAVGQRGPNILPPPMSGVQGLFGFLMGSTRPSNQDTVLSVKRTVLAVAWLAINQSLSPAEAASRQRPQRFWYGQDLSNLTLIRRRAEQAIRVGDRVYLKDKTAAPVSKHGKEDEPQGCVQVRTLLVKETRTTVNVLWQDGTRETLNAKDTVPYINPDEYDCWPGDHVLWKNEDEKIPAVVQSVNAAERTAKVRFTNTGVVDLVSVLELDPHGTNDWAANTSMEALGLHRGEFVFIHKEGTTNGVKSPMVPRIGELEGWVREVPALQTDGQIGGWRKEMIEIGNRIAERRGKDPTVEEGIIKRPGQNDVLLDWFGEVVDLKLDGTAEVIPPAGSTVTLPLERLTRLYDGLEQLEDMWDENASDDLGDLLEDEGYQQFMDEDGHWVADHDDEGWSTDEDGMDVDEEPWSPSSPTTIITDAIHPVVEIIIPPDETLPEDPHPQFSPSIGYQTLPDTSTSSEGEADDSPHETHKEEDTNTPWKRFDMLPNAPPDHAFFSSPPAQPSRSFLARLSKEYRALTNSLPDTILVRAYEDRTDLLRSLIIGPENTPYENAPFVIDWQLDSNFPQTPPIAHFLSWTNGNGRVNPNLYEEGKVCLSILGTWAGDKNETWNPSRSSLLQALVSIQGLVLVKEPWFCEPAYEKLRGTEEGIVNSRLYSEKAYVLSRGFVRRALEIPLGGLEEEINWFYYTNGKLAKVVEDANALIQKSNTHGDNTTEVDSDAAVPRLTSGGIITLQRTLTKLQTLLDASHSTPTPSSSSL
ncbi:hypothetical protein C8Q75DRAFT_768744 [Abortiporus biennis]|nr:hypothetical protein C8Q75DRAFT_768744 [Abortiporus biennis]